MNPVLVDADWDELRDILEKVARLTRLDGIHTGLASRAMEMLPKLALRQHALEEHRATHPRRHESISTMRRRVRGEVEERAYGRCEYRSPETGERCRANGVIGDHFWGKGKDETTEGVWLLCVTHDREKTRNEGGRARQVLAFRQHCLAQGYAEQVTKCNGVAAHEAAQHPEHASEKT